MVKNNEMGAVKVIWLLVLIAGLFLLWYIPNSFQQADKILTCEPLNWMQDSPQKCGQ